MADKVPDYYECGCEVVETTNVQGYDAIHSTCPEHDEPVDWERFFNNDPEPNG